MRLLLETNFSDYNEYLTAEHNKRLEIVTNALPSSGDFQGLSTIINEIVSCGANGIHYEEHPLFILLKKLLPRHVQMGPETIKTLILLSRHREYSSYLRNWSYASPDVYEGEDFDVAYKLKGIAIILKYGSNPIYYIKLPIDEFKKKISEQLDEVIYRSRKDVTYNGFDFLGIKEDSANTMDVILKRIRELYLNAGEDIKYLGLAYRLMGYNIGSMEKTVEYDSISAKENREAEYNDIADYLRSTYKTEGDFNTALLKAAKKYIEGSVLGKK